MKKLNKHLTQKIFFFLVLCLLFTAGVLTVIFSTGKFSNSAFAETYYYQRKSGSLTSVPTTQTSVSCKGLYTDKSTIILGQTITLSGIVSNYGVIRYGRVNTVGDRLSTSTNPLTLAKGFQTIKTTFKPTQAGIYVFEVNAYDSTSCKLMCSPNRLTYKNTYAAGGSCDTTGHWTQTGSCTSNGCIKWVEVKNATVNPSNCETCAGGSLTGGHEYGEQIGHCVRTTCTPIGGGYCVNAEYFCELMKDTVTNETCSGCSYRILTPRILCSSCSPFNLTGGIQSFCGSCIK